jgi:hypothetical protein
LKANWKLTLLVVSFLTLLSPAPAQKSVVPKNRREPTLGECRADRDRWYRDLDSDRVAEATYEVMNSWADEMSACIAVDEKTSTGDYVEVIVMVRGEQMRRMVLFMRTKNVWGEFLSADEAGKRYLPGDPH